MAEITRPLNLEMAATPEMLGIALANLPNACCLVPERREERTTEGGLNVIDSAVLLTPFVARLKDAGIRVSLFIEPEARTIEAARTVGADIVELHTGRYCDLALDGDSAGVAREIIRHQSAARLAHEAGLEVHAGHGLTFATVAPIASIAEIVELNIGHFLVGEALFIGLEKSVAQMREAMDAAVLRSAAGAS